MDPMGIERRDDVFCFSFKKESLAKLHASSARRRFAAPKAASAKVRPGFFCLFGEGKKPPLKKKTGGQVERYI